MRVHKLRSLSTGINSSREIKENNSVIKYYVMQQQQQHTHTHTKEFSVNKIIKTNNQISIPTRRRALEGYIEPILMYGWEAWTISKQFREKLEATEMWFLRRMLRSSWPAKKSIETVQREADTRSVINVIRKRPATFFGHVMRTN